MLPTATLYWLHAARAIESKIRTLQLSDQPVPPHLVSLKTRSRAALAIASEAVECEYYNDATDWMLDMAHANRGHRYSISELRQKTDRGVRSTYIVHRHEFPCPPNFIVVPALVSFISDPE